MTPNLNLWAVFIISVALITQVNGLKLYLRMGLDPVLTKSFPRDFQNIPLGTEYGNGGDHTLNQEIEDRKVTFLENELRSVLTHAISFKKRPMFTTALIAGDAVILDALAQANLLHKTPVVFVNTFTLFPESLEHLKEVESHYGFRSEVYQAEGVASQLDFYNKFGWDFWMRDIDQYDMICKVRICESMFFWW